MADSTAGGEMDGNLQLITVVFRPYLEVNFHLTSEFLSLLYSKDAVNDEIIANSEKILQEDSPVSVLLKHLAQQSPKGAYTAFIECLRDKGNGEIADLIEGMSQVDDGESKERWKILIQVYHDRLNKMVPTDVIPYIYCLTDEERQSIRQTEQNHGQIRGAVALLAILPKKGNEGFGQLMEALERTGMGKLAKELLDLHCSSSRSEGGACGNSLSQDVVMDDMDDCCCPSSKFTGVVVDEAGMFESNAPAENTAGCDDASPSSCDALAELGEPGCNGSRAPADINAPDDEPQPLKLRSYQEELVASSLKGMNSVIVAPTGSGKTVVAARLIKAFLDRDDGVGPRKGNISQIIRHGPNKVVFLVNKIHLVKQQSNVFRKYMGEYNVMGLSGEMSNCGSLVELLVENDVLVMTAQILLNHLQGNSDDNNHMELSMIGLLVLDECHHCQENDPYNVIMGRYCYLKLSNPETSRPQVLGLTASMGVGKANSVYGAQTHIMSVCANLDAEALCTVQDPDNKEELRQIRDKPEAEIFSELGRKNDSFVKAICGIMKQIERRIELTPGGNDWMKMSASNPKRCGTQVYEQWLVEMEKYLVENVHNEETRRKLTTCKDHLQEYNICLYLNRDARTQDALDHFNGYLEELENGTKGFSQYEQQLVDLFRGKLQHLKALATSQDPDLENPLLARLAKTLQETLADRPDSRGILFCKTRATAKALLAWLDATPSLQFLNAGKMTGSGGSEGMTQNKQGELLNLFREGKHRLIVATSVAEEGLDIQQCNVVICCNYVSNEIAWVQAQGRSRARGGKFFLIVSEELRFSDRASRNCIREKLMNEATASLQNMQKTNPDNFRKQILDCQQKSQLERLFMARVLSKMRQDKQLQAVSLLCRKCNREACTLDDIRCIDNSHHVVLNRSFPQRCQLVPHGKPIKKVDFEKLKKVLCGSPDCAQEWGIQMKYRGCITFALTPVNFIFQEDNHRRRTFKKWRDVNYKIAAMTLGELFAVAMEYDIDNDGAIDDDCDIWAPE